ncbi:ATP-grasp domain-containing protein [Fluviispira multicolorata]|uniref:ATP-grasp domain-containing protein n=1 Tax=Fluviispira multicolorata TaxID=2654512 RepID=A0A833N2A9_9BACT|nr:ATP-grasp domain-containing protein [Fluviispira multicolorata]KAB8032107.1 ATP-grasp domain-containing protein [Fluviispira multicolorata]
MKILILHRIPYHKIDYHLGINHNKHSVFYIGLESSLSSIPSELNCHKIIRNTEITYLDQVISLSKEVNGFDDIISLSEYELLEAAQLRDFLSIGDKNSFSRAMLVRDKVLMKEECAKNNIKIPVVFNLKMFYENKSYRENILSKFNKLILKPRSGASSEGVSIIDSKSSESKIKSIKNIEDFELEEFIEGSIFHVDGIVNNGNILRCVSSKYINTCFDYAYNKLPLGSVQQYSDITNREWIQKIICALKINEGSFHLEWILRGNEAIFLEIANRVGGADVVETFQRKTKIHLPSAELALRVGEKYTSDFSHSYESENFYGWFVYPGHIYNESRIKIDGFSKFVESKLLINYNKLSNKTSKNMTYQAYEVPLSGVVVGKSPDEVRTFIENIFYDVNIQPI